MIAKTAVAPAITSEAVTAQFLRGENIKPQGAATTGEFTPAVLAARYNHASVVAVNPSFNFKDLAENAAGASWSLTGITSVGGGDERARTAAAATATATAAVDANITELVPFSGRGSGAPSPVAHTRSADTFSVAAAAVTASALDRKRTLAMEQDAKPSTHRLVSVPKPPLRPAVSAAEVMGLTPEALAPGDAFVAPAEADMLSVWHDRREHWREDYKRKRRAALRHRNATGKMTKE